MSSDDTSSSSSALNDPSLVFAGLIIQFLITLTVCLISLICFETLRHRLGWIYAPKYHQDSTVNLSKSKKPHNTAKKNSVNRLFDPGTGWFSWVKPTLKSKDSTIALVAGLDALMFSKFLGFAARYFAILTGLSVLLLIPMNVYVGYLAHNSQFTIHILSIASVVRHGSSELLLWAPALFTTLFSGIACRMLWRLWQEYADHRGRYYSDQNQHGKSNDSKSSTGGRINCRTLMITNVPHGLRSERAIKLLIDQVMKSVIGSRLSLYKRHIYGSSENDASVVERVYIDRRVDRLEKLVEGREQKLERLELQLLRWIRRSGGVSNGSNSDDMQSIAEEKNISVNRPFLGRLAALLFHPSSSTDKPKFQEIVSKRHGDQPLVLGESVSIDQLLKIGNCLGTDIDGLLHDIQQADKTVGGYREQHNDFYRRHDRSAEGKFQQNFPTKSTVFVTLRTRMAQLLLTSNDSLPVDADRFSLMVNQAPEPRDLIWQNISVSLKERLVRKISVGILVALLVVFYLFPVMAIISMTDLKTLTKFIPSLAHVASNTWAQALNQNVSPAIILTAFMSLLYWLLYRLSMLERPISRSQLEFQMMTKYFYFELFNVLFAFTIGNSVFDVVSAIFDNPRNVLNILATSLPENASFFVNYVVFGVSMFAVEILSVKRVAIQYFYYLFVSVKTPRTKFHLKNQRFHIDYGLWYAVTLLIFVISITYSTIYPLIVPFAMLYFSMAYLMFRYQLLYVYTPQYETGGSFFADFVFGKVILGLLIQQATMLGYLLLKEAYWPALVIILPTIAGTLVFRSFCWRAVGKRTQLWGGQGAGLVKTLELLDCSTAELVESGGVDGVDLLSDSSSQTSSASASPKPVDRRVESATTLDMEAVSAAASVQTLARNAHEEEESAFNSEYDPQTYVNPVFHRPLKQLWLPNKARETLYQALMRQKGQ